MNKPIQSERYLVVILLIAVLLATSCKKADPHGSGADWAYYLGHPSSSQYSTLDQINRSNVGQLEVAWSYDTGEQDMYQTNQLVVEGILYAATPNSRVIALDGAAGKLLWSFDPDAIHDGLADNDQRGLMYWKDGDHGRLFTNKGSYLYCIDTRNGKLVTSFGTEGSIHLGENMDVEGAPGVYLNTPGYVYRDMIIIGANVAESVPGAVRAFDARTGDRRWIFHTLPRPGEFGSNTWPDGYLGKTGGASDWSGLSIDTERGIVYISTETAGPDFYGGERYGENLFANSVVALNADTGERIWHQQLVHHDLWDLDLPQPPTLLTVMHEGKERDIVAQGTKMGRLFVFDRFTGEPLWPIEERPAAESRIPEVKAWPTQPFQTKPPPLIRQWYTENDVPNISPKAELMGKEVLAKSGNFGPFPPPSLDQVIMFPGYDGGMEWGGAAADPDGILYVNVNELPWFYQLIPTRQTDGKPLSSGELLYRANCAACHGMDLTGYPDGGFPALADVGERLTREVVMHFIVNGGGRMPSFDRLTDNDKKDIVDFLYGIETPPSSRTRREGIPPYVFRGFQRWFDDEGYPAIKPPWGTLNAVDLNTGEIKWKVPLGEIPELTKRGIPITGTENYGGPVVTAGGLIFIGATNDGKMRAFDKDTGDMLWEHDLPFDGNATPSVYAVDGKQYVIISCGGAKKKPVHGGILMAFSLPD